MTMKPLYKQGDIVEFIDSDGDTSVHYISMFRVDKGKYALCKHSCEVGWLGKDYKSAELVFENRLRLVNSK